MLKIQLEKEGGVWSEAQEMKVKMKVLNYSEDTDPPSFTPPE